VLRGSVPRRRGRFNRGDGRRGVAVPLPRDGTCLYDIRVVYDTNTAAEKRRVNTCELTEVVFP
jgi:hypothetical protein